MKRWLVLGVVFIAAVAHSGQQREQYPGQSRHAQPPDGWYCSSHSSADANHKCECLKQCVPELDEEGNPTGKLTVQEDRKCGAYCHADRCACAVKCKET